jgi:hypothetical protein
VRENPKKGPAVFPSPPRDLHVYVQLTSFLGDVEVRLVCMRVDLSDAQEIYTAQHTVRLRGKLAVEQMHFVWHEFQFPSAGEYAFQLWSKGQCIAERRLSVRQKEA